MPAPQFDTTYARLPEQFFTRMVPSPVKAPQLLKLNLALANELGLDQNWLLSNAGLAMLAGNAFPPSAASIATVYAGHQFGYFSPQLGDGRALLIGEIVTPEGQRRDIQLKGSGPTPYSRRGDGRSALAPVLREYLISEAMHALGIPTTRSLAVVSTGEWVWREPEQPGGILTRIASSHIRVGTFQFFASRGDTDGIKLLCDHVIERHYPAVRGHENPALALLDCVVAAQARLIAGWMLIGFLHGVMNTDNMTLSGETIDYGPCAFLDQYEPGKVFSSIDRDGRYAFGNQPRIAHWNLARLAETLLPLLHDSPDKAVELATASINRFPVLFEKATAQGLRTKLGLLKETEGDLGLGQDLSLGQDLLAIMAANGADFTLAFRHLSMIESSPEALESFRSLFAVSGAIDSWILKWRERLSHEETTPAQRNVQMMQANPAVIPRNHLVEEALASATSDEPDLGPFEALLEALLHPFDDQLKGSRYALPPSEVDRGYRTFCGT